MRLILTTIILTMLAQPLCAGTLVEIQLVNRLDEQRGFCIDIRGHKERAKVHRGLQAHTCYSYQGEVAVDQGFDSSKLMKNQFQLPAFNVCMEAESVTASASLQLSKCRGGQLQRFEWDKKGKIHLMDDKNLCLTVAQGESRTGGGGSPVHLIRNLSMETCSDTLKAFQRWGMRVVE